MADMKTKVHEASVEDFLNRIKHEGRREDAFAVLKLMKSVTRKKPKMWGSAIVGFDTYHYKYASGRQGESCMIAFSPRSQATTLYIGASRPEYATLLKKLGKHTKSGGCLHIKKVADVNVDVLRQLVTAAYGYMKKKYS